MATMKQVAQRAGVSTSTVSHVINQTRPVREDVRKRVQAIIDEMRYIPSAVARSLKNDKTRTIGVVIPDNTSPCRAELICGIEEAARKAGYHILLCNGGAEPLRQTARLRALIEQRIDGLVLVEGSAHDEWRALLGVQQIPVVLADLAVEGIEADFAGIDHDATGYLAIRHLLGLGHRDIAIVRGPHGRQQCDARLAGAVRALEEAGRALRPECVVVADGSCDGGFAAFGQLLALQLPPTAVFACNDLMALGGLCAAAESKVAVPAQLSVVGCDDIHPAAYAAPRLTTVAQPQRALGQLVAETLVARIQGGGRPARRELLQGELVVRQSTAPPRLRR